MDVSNSFSLKKNTFLRNFPTNLLFSRLPSSSEMYCTPCSVQFRKDTRILLYFRKGKEKRPSSYFQVEIHVRTTEKFANSIARENFRRALLNFFKQELSIRGIRLQHLVQKKKKYSWTHGVKIFRDSSRLDIYFARAEGRKGEKLTNSFERVSIGCRIKRKEFQRREYSLLFSRYLFTRPFLPRNRCTYVTASLVIRNVDPT